MYINPAKRKWCLVQLHCRVAASNSDGSGRRQLLSHPPPAALSKPRVLAETAAAIRKSKTLISTLISAREGPCSTRANADDPKKEVSRACCSHDTHASSAHPQSIQCLQHVTLHVRCVERKSGRGDEAGVKGTQLPQCLDCCSNHARLRETHGNP